jgi:hypothetical protein
MFDQGNSALKDVCFLASVHSFPRIHSTCPRAPTVTDFSMSASRSGRRVPRPGWGVRNTVP